MSYTTVLALAEGKHPETIEELRNGHGAGPAVWDDFCQKYLGTKPFGYMYGIDKLWPKYKDKTIPKHHRAVLMMTYDLAYVSKPNFARAAKDLKLYLGDFPPAKDRVNHWGYMAKLYAGDPDHIAIGLHQTSVTENPFDGEWNEEKEDYDLIDWAKTFEIYEELDSL